MTSFGSTRMENAVKPRISRIRMTPSQVSPRPTRMWYADSRTRAALAGVEELRHLSRRAPLRNKDDQEPPRAGDRQGQDYGDAQDSDYLLDLGADQDPIGNDVVNKVVRDRAGQALCERVGDERRPARRRNEPGEEHVSGIDTKSAERDENEHR